MPNPLPQIRWIREPGTRTKWPVYQKIKTECSESSPTIWLTADNKYWNHDFNLVKLYTLQNCSAWRDNLDIERITTQP